MSNQPTNGVQSQLPTESGIGDFTDVELMNVTGGGLIRIAGHAIVDGANVIVGGAKAAGQGIGKGTKAAGQGIGKGAKATWEFIY